MAVLVPLMLFGWIPLSILFFYLLKPHHAVLAIVIGGWLFLPQYSYDLQGIPDFYKNTSIAFGLVLGGRLSGKRQAATFQWRVYDIPLMLWCFSPLITCLFNGLGVRDGISGIYDQLIFWGIPYLAGRVYFDDFSKLRDLCLGLVIGGLVYMPLCLYEIRMSPQLSNIFYDFFPHSFLQHFRYGGFRPIVFLQHGLMVSLWMALTTTAIFWLWRCGEVKHIKGFPIALFFLLMAITTILCKSANGWFALVVGIACYYLYRLFKSIYLIRLLLLSLPIYMGLRISGILQAGFVENKLSNILDQERVESLAIRLLQEDLFIERTLLQPIIGWGGYGRGWPFDPTTGERLIQMIDAMWLIFFNTYGFFGLITSYMVLFTGPWLVFGYFHKNNVNSSSYVLLILVLFVILFSIDSLFNGMLNPIYILISGSMAGFALNDKENIFNLKKNIK